jgi:hypothetical protein
MRKYQKLLTVERVIELEKRLSQIPSVAQFDLAEEPEGHRLAHALSHWEDSFAAVLDNVLPKVADERTSAEDLADALNDVGEELRHILYHINDVKFFGYLLDAEM